MNLDKSAVPEKSPWFWSVEIPIFDGFDSIIKLPNFLNPAVWFNELTGLSQVVKSFWDFNSYEKYW